ncbi:hypothetical protein V5F49_15260 [Xanthobacter sp. V3C-3]|uniref:hypothetical protein n=1 Tax=Xanthobacter lutulentifluminis TaxID=3119935 RepID=UPI00372B095A
MQLYRFPSPIGAIVATLVTVTALTAGPATAQARPDSLSMTCAEAANLVTTQGAVVIGTGPNLFDRYVREVRFCSGAEQLKPEWIKTRDNPQCFVGYVCYVPSRDNNNSR